MDHTLLDIKAFFLWKCDLSPAEWRFFWPGWRHFATAWPIL